jgi:TPR repeat protein
MNRALKFLVATCLLLVPCIAANPPFADALKAAKAGDKNSQYIVGMMYLFGQGTKQNIPEGARWIETSARAGVPQAQVALAALYDVGQGVPLDAARATQLRQQAAKAGNPTARGQLEEDVKLPGQRDFRRASALTDFKLYAAALPYAQRSAEAGSANGQLLLGRAHHFALGTPKNHAEALKWYLKSDAGKLADGSRAVAYMYEFGLGVAVDRKTALVYYDRAAARGSALAKRAAANLRSPDYDRPANFNGGGGSSGSPCSGGYNFNYAQGSCDPMYPGMNPYNP